ncbi:hypothetical protein RHGRI_038677 [Rhododendron griersonianum]|uniref:Uncharacterized protein n=1 Tax=Rhododendron griersonianum TaxID=479676 RepID=A0AAV6HID0_9ERIC|nr:hypothetical protein RHGRI_038677 [Rhododendron griersonianum]
MEDAFSGLGNGTKFDNKVLQTSHSTVGHLSTKLRLVRCPKCRQLLQESANVPVYKCGGCYTVLRVETGFPSPPSSKSIVLHRRPGYGQMGSKCLVKANHFLAEISKRDLTQYSVTIEPEVGSTKLNKAIMTQLVKLHRDTYLGKRLPVYDGREALYTAGVLPFTSKEFTIQLAEEDEGLGIIRYISVGRFFYSPNINRPQPLGISLQSCRGFCQSVKPTQMGLSLYIVGRPPDQHGEGNTSTAREMPSHNVQNGMEGELVGQNQEANVLRQDFMGGLIALNTESGLITVGRPPDQHGEKNTSTACEEPSNNVETRMEIEPVGQNQEANVFQRDFTEGLIALSTENGLIIGIVKTPPFHDSYPDKLSY